MWASPGRNAQTLQQFFDLLGDRRHSIQAVSIDMSGGYQKPIQASCPQAEICFDPFHVVRLGQRAVDQVRRDEQNAHERSKTKTGKWIKGTRWSLLKSPEKQSLDQLAKLQDLAVCEGIIGSPAGLDGSDASGGTARSFGRSMGTPADERQ